jgi:hypothetical protein
MKEGRGVKLTRWVMVLALVLGLEQRSSLYRLLGGRTRRMGGSLR